MDNKTRFRAELDEWLGAGEVEVEPKGISYRANVQAGQWNIYVFVPQSDEYSVSASACGMWVRDHQGVHEAMEELAGELTKKIESIHQVRDVVRGV